MDNGSNDIPFNNYSVDFFSALDNITVGGSGTGGSSFFASLIDSILFIWAIFTAFSFLITLALLFGVIYAYVRGSQVEGAQHEYVLEMERQYREFHGTEVRNWRWAEVLNHIGGDNPNSWKLAIIEADIMLGEVLDSAGYAGASIGDQLKSISPSSVRSLDAAWEAHKVRNQIAHTGTDFVLTKKLAQDTITQYKQVFEEFKAI